MTTAICEIGQGVGSRSQRRGVARECIGYTITSCLLGRLLLAGTERGICALTLADEVADLERALRKDFPRAEWVLQEEQLRPWAAEVCARLTGSAPQTDLPLDVRGTPFQRRVWQELCAIPAGQTRSYAEIAERIGRPTAVRAVARAIATNPISVLIPCHRVIRTGGGMGGYRWGLKRKEALLAGEKGAGNYS